MINLLGIFSSIGDKIKELVILIVIVAIVIACIKYKNGRIFMGFFALIVFCVFSVYCAIQVNYYYSASGGIKGQLQILYNPNQVQITDTVQYDFSNVVLTADGDKYSAKITTDEVLELVLDESATYGVYVNGSPLNDVDIGNDYVVANYRYAFLDEHKQPILDDTLTLRFAFYSNSTYLTVSTSGGAEAVKYWNTYFNKNKFIVTIDNKGFEYNDSVDFGSGDVSNFSIVTYYYENELYVKQVYLNGTTINLPGIEHSKWLVNDIEIDSSYVVNENITVYGEMIRGQLTIDANGGVYEGGEICNIFMPYGETVTIATPTREGYVFAGWTNGEILNNNTYTFTDATETLIARWDAIYSVTLNSQESDVSGIEKLYYVYNSVGYYTDLECKISLTDSTITNLPTREGYAFKGYFTELNGAGTQYVSSQGLIINALYSNLGDITLYAYWEAISGETVYIITLDNQDADISGTDKLYYVYNSAGYYTDSECTVSLSNSKITNLPTREGYTFRGHFTEPGGAGTQYISSQGLIMNELYNNIGDITLYAYWI